MQAEVPSKMHPEGQDTSLTRNQCSVAISIEDFGTLFLHKNQCSVPISIVDFGTLFLHKNQCSVPISIVDFGDRVPS